MGWWSETVMGGDPPLDILCTFEKVLNRGVDDITAAHLEENEKLLVATIESIKDDIDRCVGWQVLAHLMLSTGASLSFASRDSMREAALNDATEAWNNKKRRRLFMLDLAVKVEEYVPGQAVELATDDEYLSDVSAKAKKLQKEEEQAVENEKDDIVDRLWGLAAFHGFELDLDRIRPLLTRVRDTSPAPQASIRKSQEAMAGLADALLGKSK